MGCRLEESWGCLVLNKQGSIISIEVDEAAFAEYVRNGNHIKNNHAIASKIAIRAGLPGSEQTYLSGFNKLFAAGQYDEAAKLVAKSPGSILRNRETIEKFKILPKPEVGSHPILKYFSILLENGKLNDIETREICTLVL